MNLQITAVYAALLGLLFILLSFRVSKHRLAAHVSLGDGNNPLLAQAIRAHANFAEYVPLGLILVGLVEAQGTNSLAVHILGGGLLFSRLLHAWGLAQAKVVNNARKIGIVLTWLAILLSSIFLLIGRL